MPGHRNAVEFYISLALPFVPLVEGRKIPAIKGWQDFGAARDAARIRQFWARRPWCNVGACTGDGFFVLDIDSHHDGDASLALIEKWGVLPATWTVLTPSGGRHLYFRCGIGCEWSTIPKNSAGKIGRGLDIRGVGGLAVLPPSRIKRADNSVGIYTWTPGLAPDEIEAAAMPFALAVAFRGLERKPTARSHLRSGTTTRRVNFDGLIAAILRAGEGQRNSIAYWAGCRLGEHVRDGALSYAQAVALVVGAAERAGLTSEEALATAESGVDRGMRG